MPTHILDKIIQTQFGKSLIMWFFLAACALVGFLLWERHSLTQDLKLVNNQRAAEQTFHNQEMNKMSKEHVEELKKFMIRLSEVEKEAKK